MPFCLCLRGQTHTQKIDFSDIAHFKFTVINFIKQLSRYWHLLLTHSVITLCLQTRQGLFFGFFPSRLVLVPDFFPSHWPTTIYERLSGLTNGKQFSACEKERMGPIKAETILQWQMKNHWALSALLWQSLMMTNWFINRTWFSTVSSTVNLIEIFSFAAELQHVSAGRVIFAPGGYYSWKKKENDSFKRRHQLVQ